MKALAALLVTAFLPLGSLGADAVDPQRVAEARLLIAVLQPEKQIEGMGVAVAQAMTRDLLDSQPGLNQRVLQVTMEEAMQSIKRNASSPGGIYDALAEAYASQFSVVELRQIRQFYESPIGARALLAAPEVMKQVLPALAQSSRALAPQVCARAKARLAAEKNVAGDNLKCPS